MSHWNINPSACTSVFQTADSDITTLETQHKTVSTKSDDACTPFSDPKVKAIHASIVKAYNRVLTHEMTWAEASGKHVVQAGRNAFTAYQQGQDDIGTSIENTANSIPEPHIFDGKAVPK